MRRCLAALVVLALAACDGQVTVSSDEAAVEGYTLEVRADEHVQAYLVTAPDGRVVAARAAEGASALMSPSDAQAFAATAPASRERTDVMSLRLPGLDLSVSGDPDGSGEEGGRVSINAGGRRILVNAEEGGAEGDRAQVLISGASAADARDFIAHADQLSPAVQAQMLEALDLD